MRVRKRKTLMKKKLPETGNARLTAAERETIITFDEESDRAEIYTCSSIVITRCKKFCKSNPAEWEEVHACHPGFVYRCPVKYIRLCAKDKGPAKE
jgi:hypothetical protein